MLIIYKPWTDYIDDFLQKSDSFSLDLFDHTYDEEFPTVIMIKNPSC